MTYSILALIAMLANIMAQDGCLRLYTGPYAIPLSMIIGTGIGLIIKYKLDKHYIFHFRATNVAHDTQTFFLYTLMGLVTTAIFWGFELGFDYAFATKEMRYFGGIMGLIIGYITKYHLDKRYVFYQGAP